MFPGGLLRVRAVEAGVVREQIRRRSHVWPMSRGRPTAGGPLVVHPQATRRPRLRARHRRDDQRAQAGRRNVPVRRNSNQLEICIGAAARCARRRAVRGRGSRHLEHPRCRLHASQHRIGTVGAVELLERAAARKTRRALLRRNPPPLVIDTEIATTTQHKTVRTRKCARFRVTRKVRVCALRVSGRHRSARVEGDPLAVESVRRLAISGIGCARHSAALQSGHGAAQRTTHSFFATLGACPEYPQKTAPAGTVTRRPRKLPLHHDGGYSIVDGERTIRRRLADARRAELDRPRHSYRPPRRDRLADGSGSPLHIGMESLIWQEDLNLPILTLGSQAGVTGYVGRGNVEIAQ